MKRKRLKTVAELPNKVELKETPKGKGILVHTPTISIVPLTWNELRVLKLLLKDVGTIVPTSEVRSLWQDKSVNRVNNTMRVTMLNLKKKLSSHNIPLTIKSKYNTGYFAKLVA